MAQLQIGKHYHRMLGWVEVTDQCIALSKLSPMDTTSTFVEHNGDIKEVTEALIDKTKTV